MATKKCEKIHEHLFLPAADVDGVVGVLDFPISLRVRREHAWNKLWKWVCLDEEHKLCRFHVLYKFPRGSDLPSWKKGAAAAKEHQKKMCDEGIRFCEILPSFLLCCVLYVCQPSLWRGCGSSHQSKIQNSPQSNLPFPCHQFILPKCVRVLSASRQYLHFQ